MSSWLPANLGSLDLGDLAGAVNKLTDTVKNIEKNFDTSFGFERSEGSSDPVSEVAAYTFGFTPPNVSIPALTPPPTTTPADRFSSLVQSEIAHGEEEEVQVPKPHLHLPPPAPNSWDSDREVPGVNPTHPQYPAPQIQTDPPVTPNSDATTESASDRVDASVPIPEEMPGAHPVAEYVRDLAPEAVVAVAGTEGPSLEIEIGRDVEVEETSEQVQQETVAVSGPDVVSGVVQENGRAKDDEDPSAVEDMRKSEQPVGEPVEGHVMNGTSHPLIESAFESRDEKEGVEEKVEPSLNSQPRSAETEEVEGGAVLEVSPQGEVGDGRLVALGEEELRRQLVSMEATLMAAGKQARVKADEVARYMNANDELEGQMAEAKMSADAEMGALREEYQQRLSGAERKVYALTKERDMLRRDQSRKGESATLLKEKDEMIKQVMAEGEELSRKQAAQEAQMKKLRVQIREHEESEQRLTSRVEAEEAKVEALKRDKSAAEAALQEAVERSQVEAATQKEYFSTALAENKAALAAAEARVDSEAKADLDRRLRDSSERERALVRSVDELRQTLSRAEQQAAFREDMLRQEVEDLERRCQSAEARHEELVARMPDSTRPLLRQMEAMQESASVRMEALTGVERTLNMRLQEAEGKAGAAEERERSCNERMTQTLSRCAVMEAHLSLLRAEQSQTVRSLEKERSRAGESRQEYLAAQEGAAVHEGRARQLEGELKEARAKARRELQEERACRDALEQEVEAERAAMAEHEKRSRAEKAANALRPTASMSSTLGSAEEHSLVAGGLHGQEGGALLLLGPTSPFGSSRSLLGSAGGMEQIEKRLRHREGELSSYSARVAALEATRDSLAEELVGTTQALEAVRSEAQVVPGMRQELEALRRRHASALELMGERDEQVEELRADLADVKEMYREQIDMLVRQIEQLSKTMAAAVGKEAT